MEKQRLLEVVKQHSDRDAIGMILSNYADRCSSKGALISVNQFYKIADVLIEWAGQKPDASANTLPIDIVMDLLVDFQHFQILDGQIDIDEDEVKRNAEIFSTNKP